MQWKLTADMFRDTKFTKIDPANFGAGSIVQDGNVNYLVAACGKSVALLDLQNFQMLGSWVSVADPNFLSQDEARQVCNQIEGATFSDHTLLTIGIKGYSYRK